MVTFLSMKAELVEHDLTQQGLIPTDPKDDIVIATALVGKADYIVSGDRQLTVFKDFQGIPILTPAAFVKQANL